MNIGVSGVVVNQHGELLVIQRDDTRTWAIPGGSLDAGELPTEGVIREVEEETGFKVLPVRLVAVHYVALPQRPFITFMFRCLLRGGEPKTSRESIKVGYVKTNPLDVRMLGFHKKRVLPALTHRGKALFETYELSSAEKLGSELLRKGVYPLMNLRRRLFNSNPYVPPDTWRVAAYAVIRNVDGAVLWMQNATNGLWELPGGVAQQPEAPWDTAVDAVQRQTGLSVRATELTGVYLDGDSRAQRFLFSAENTLGTQLPIPHKANFAWHQPGDEAPNTAPAHIEHVADAVDPQREVTLFKRQGV